MDLDELNSKLEFGEDTRILHSFHLLGITILYWDHIITFDREIDFLWIRKKTVSSIWFFLVRYLGFAGNIPVVLFSFMSVSQAGCRTYYVVHQVILILTQCVVSVVLVIRTYALYGRDKRILACLVVSGACLIAASSWAEHGQKSIPDPLFQGCNLGITRISGYHLSVSWIAVFLLDTLILSLTVYRTHSMRKELGGASHMPLHMLIVRDSGLYYATMALANLANIITYYSTGPLLRGSLATFSNCVSVSIMSRLMLHLHEKANIGILSHVTINSTFPSTIATECVEIRGLGFSTIPPLELDANPDGISEVPRDGAV